MRDCPDDERLPWWWETTLRETALTRDKPDETTLQRDHRDETALQRDHRDERPPCRETTVMRPPCREITLMRDHPAERAPWWDNPEERPHLWGTTLKRDHTCERPPWRETILMRDCPEERPLWGETILMRDRPEERPPWWETTLMRDRLEQRPPLFVFFSSWNPSFIFPRTTVTLFLRPLFSETLPSIFPCKRTAPDWGPPLYVKTMHLSINTHLAGRRRWWSRGSSSSWRRRWQGWAATRSKGQTSRRKARPGRWSSPHPEEQHNTVKILS